MSGIRQTAPSASIRFDRCAPVLGRITHSGHPFGPPLVRLTRRAACFRTRATTGPTALGGGGRDRCRAGGIRQRRRGGARCGSVDHERESRQQRRSPDAAPGAGSPCRDPGGGGDVRRVLPAQPSLRGRRGDQGRSYPPRSRRGVPAIPGHHRAGGGEEGERPRGALAPRPRALGAPASSGGAAVMVAARRHVATPARDGTPAGLGRGSSISHLGGLGGAERPWQRLIQLHRHLTEPGSRALRRRPRRRPDARGPLRGARAAGHGATGATHGAADDNAHPYFDCNGHPDDNAHPYSDCNGHLDGVTDRWPAAGGLHGVGDPGAELRGVDRGRPRRHRAWPAT